jgi:uncharacterized protein (DUF1015 family)
MAGCKAKTEPILEEFKNEKHFPSAWANALQASPLYQFLDQDLVSHEVWKITDVSLEAEIIRVFAAIPSFYIADGHHRYAAAVRLSRLQKNPNQKILAVVFPHDQLRILPYHRVALLANLLSLKEFLQKLEANFKIETDDSCLTIKPREFGLFCQGKWTKLIGLSTTGGTSTQIPKLDVTLLHETILDPIFGIKDERRDSRLEFVGGADAKSKIEQLVNEKKNKIGFLLHPVSIMDLFAYADQNQVMPPKSTWFEPKLKSGLFVLPYD